MGGGEESDSLKDGERRDEDGAERVGGVEATHGGDERAGDEDGPGLFVGGSRDGRGVDGGLGEGPGCERVPGHVHGGEVGRRAPEHLEDSREGKKGGVARLLEREERLDAHVQRRVRQTERREPAGDRGAREGAAGADGRVHKRRSEHGWRRGCCWGRGGEGLGSDGRGCGCGCGGVGSPPRGCLAGGVDDAGDRVVGVDHELIGGGHERKEVDEGGEEVGCHRGECVGEGEAPEGFRRVAQAPHESLGGGAADVGRAGRENGVGAAGDQGSEGRVILQLSAEAGDLGLDGVEELMDEGGAVAQEVGVVEEEFLPHRVGPVGARVRDVAEDAIGGGGGEHGHFECFLLAEGRRRGAEEGEDGLHHSARGGHGAAGRVAEAFDEDSERLVCV